MTERRALILAFVLNAGMAVVEIAAALASRSVALMADAVDFVEDSVIYLLALRMGGATPEVERRHGTVIAALMALPGLAALWQVGRQVAAGVPPHGTTIWTVSALALAANLASAVIILAARRRRSGGGLGLSAAWLSSRNDALANCAMIAAGILVAATGSGWPDLIVGLGVAALHLSGGWQIWRAARVRT